MRYHVWSRYYLFEELERGFNLVLYKTDGEYLNVIEVATGSNKATLLNNMRRKHGAWKIEAVKRDKVETVH